MSNITDFKSILEFATLKKVSVQSVYQRIAREAKKKEKDRKLEVVRLGHVLLVKEK
jgi:hypothetical protein